MCRLTACYLIPRNNSKKNNRIVKRFKIQKRYIHSIRSEKV
jgi:hypothetical protein